MLLSGEPTKKLSTSTSAKEEGLLRFLQYRREDDKRENRSFIELNKKQPVGSKLEALLRRAYK